MRCAACMLIICPHNCCHYNVSHLPPDLTGADEINMKLKCLLHISSDILKAKKQEMRSGNKAEKVLGSHITPSLRSGFQTLRTRALLFKALLFFPALEHLVFFPLYTQLQGCFLFFELPHICVSVHVLSCQGSVHGEHTQLGEDGSGNLWFGTVDFQIDQLHSPACCCCFW